ncbi:MAG: hypothetical protein K2M94_00350 [Paramuribaculum sp.]|nr:hypothetical protein [Paramuribaculum sp.]
MEEEKYFDLFSDYNPELSSDRSFMAHLERNIEAVEFVKSQAEQLHRKNRIAIISAAVAGFVFGVLSTLCYPMLSEFVRRWSLSETELGQFVADYGSVMIWIVICAVVITMTYSVYDIALAIANKSDEPKR